MSSDSPCSSVKMRQYKGRADRIKATIFVALIILVLAYLCFTVFAHSGPIVLGSEMNSNGQVEYMCIGRSCENLGHSFTWKDQ